MGELRLCCVPHLDRIGVAADQVFQVHGHRLAVLLEARLVRPGGVDALGNVEDDAGEPVLIDPDLLVVGDFAQIAGHGAIELATKSSGKLNSRVVVCLVPNVGKVAGEVAHESPAKQGSAFVTGRHS